MSTRRAYSRVSLLWRILVSVREESSQRWSISLFGPLEIRSPEGNSYRIASRKAGELLAYLAIRRQPIVERDALVAALWPDVDEETGRNRLKQTLAVLRREVEGIPLRSHGKNELELVRADVEIDYHSIDQKLKWFRLVPERRRTQAARELFEIAHQGLLPGWTTPWLLADRHRYEALCLELSREIQANQALANVPFRLGDDFADTDIPLLGRERESAALTAWVRSKDPNDLRLVGGPGTGKSRLLEEFLETSRHVCDAVLCFSGKPSEAGSWLDRFGRPLGIQTVERLVDDLSHLLAAFKRPLLAVDDIDEASAELKDWLDGLLRAVPRLRLIATSTRMPERPATETVMVGPLPAYQEEEPVASSLLRRFAERAGVAESVLVEDTENLLRISQQLDGIPSNLEAAVDWLSLMSPEALLEKVTGQPEMILSHSVGGRPSMMQRVTTLIDPMPLATRHAALGIAACRSGCGEALADELLGRDWPMQVKRLLDYSIIHRTTGKAGPRFAMVRSIQTCVCTIEGHELLSAATEELRTATLRLGRNAVLNFETGDRRSSLVWLEDEHENLLDACRRSLGRPADIDICLELLEDMRDAFSLIGRSPEFAEVLSEALTKAAIWIDHLGLAAQVPVKRSQTLRLVGLGLTEGAVRTASEFRERIAKTGSHRHLASAYVLESDLLVAKEEPSAAVASLQRAVELNAKAGLNRRALALELRIAKLETGMGLVEAASDRKDRAYRNALQTGDRHTMGEHFLDLAGEALNEQRWFDAGALAERSTEEFKSVGETASEFDAEVAFALALIHQGALEQARQVTIEAAEIVHQSDPIQMAKLNIVLSAFPLGTKPRIGKLLQSPEGSSPPRS